MNTAEPVDRPTLHVVGPDDAADVLSPPVRREPARICTSWTAADIMAMDFPEPRWAVPGIFSEGVNLLCGPPKVGKSWMSLALGVDVALGGKAFGTIDVEQGPVLYLALEDTARRLQTRLRKVLDDRKAPAGLTLATSCPPLPQGGDEAIAAWIDRNRDTRMVIIDVFAKLRGMSVPGMSAYDADYGAVGRAKKVADNYGVAVVLVHHVRKAGSDDFLSEVSGTNGLAGPPTPPSFSAGAQPGRRRPARHRPRRRRGRVRAQLQRRSRRLANARRPRRRSSSQRHPRRDPALAAPGTGQRAACHRGRYGAQ